MKEKIKRKKIRDLTIGQCKQCVLSMRKIMIEKKKEKHDDILRRREKKVCFGTCA